ncbi:MAG: GGDEF domain-containing protein [Coprobacillus sp.]
MEMDLLKNILNGLSELIYVSDIKTYELYYMNDQGMKAFGIDKFHGQKCYELLQGKDAPCEFCTNHLLSTDKYYTWTRLNPLTGKTYLLKDKFVHWDGHFCRIEMAFDQENRIKREEAIQDLLNMETVLVKCITELHQSTDIYARVQEMIEIVGRFLQADRTYVFLIKGNHMDNTFEWCNEGVQPEIDHLQNLDVHLLDRWMVNFDKGECFVLENIQDIEKTSDEYIVLNSQGIHSLIAAPLESDGKLIGYLGVDNPPKDKIEKILPFFTTLGYFLSSSIVKHRNETMLQQMSFYDSLTGLYNRNRYMEDLYKFEQTDNIQMGIFYIDMNGLKVLNDTYGHSQGDKALKQIADVLKENFDNEMLYRLGGDEFVVFYHHQSEENFYRKVNVLKNSFLEHQCSIAMGYQYVTSGQDIQKAIKEADEMMYENKKQYYRNNLMKRYRYYNDEFVEFLNQDHFMRLLEEHRFSIYLQPKMTIKDKTVQGAEVLVRYRDKHDQLITPNQFIPLLENCGFMYLLDFFVMDRTCQVIGEWIENGYSVYPVSINLSHTTLHHPHFIEYLHDVWNRYALSKDLIQFEISRSADYESVDETLRIVQSIKDSGFHIIIDDFGSNQDNIYLFSSVNFDVMKIDRVLIQKLLDNNKIYALISSIVEICHKMGVSIVAKGVENTELLHAIEEMEIDEIQGYLFSGPVSLDEFTDKYIVKKEKS